MRRRFGHLPVLMAAALLGGPVVALSAAAPEAHVPAALVFPVFDMAPWAYFDEGCRPQGVAVDSLRVIADQAGLPLVLRHERNVDALEAATRAQDRTSRAAQEAVLVRLSSFAERPGMAKVGDLAVFDIELRVVPAPNVVLPTMSAMAGRRIGMDRDELRVGEKLAALGAQPQPFDDYPGMIDAMLAGRLDGVAGLGEGLVYALRYRPSGPELLRRGIPLRRDPVWLHVGWNAPADWSPRLRDAVGVFVESGRFTTLRDRYLSRAAKAPLKTRQDCSVEGG